MILYIWIGCLTLAFCISLVWVYKKIEEFQKDIKCLLKDVERVDKVQKEEFKRKMEKKEKKRMKRLKKIKTVKEREAFLFGK